MTVTLCLSCSSDAQPEPWGPLCWVLASFTASYQQLLWTPTHQGFKPLRPGVAFPTTSPTGLQLYWPSDSTGNWTGTGTQLSYIIVRRPLDLWNRMFNRHQAEITVMQFTGHSLPGHQSMSVPWEFFSSSHFISQFPPTRFPLITATRMCHFLPVHLLGMAFLAGSKVKIQHLVICRFPLFIISMTLFSCQIQSLYPDCISSSW